MVYSYYFFCFPMMNPNVNASRTAVIAGSVLLLIINNTTIAANTGISNSLKKERPVIVCFMFGVLIVYA